MSNDKYKYLVGAVFCAGVLMASRLEACCWSDDNTERTSTHQLLQRRVPDIRAVSGGITANNMEEVAKETKQIQSLINAGHIAEATAKLAILENQARELFNQRMKEQMKGLPSLQDLEKQANELEAIALQFEKKAKKS